MRRMYRSILNYFYVRKAFSQVPENTNIIYEYTLREQDGEAFEYPKVTKFGVLYLFIKVTEDIHSDKKLLESYLTNKLNNLNKNLMDLELYGIIDQKKPEVFEQEDYYMYLIKYAPKTGIMRTLAIIGFLLIIISLILRYIFL